MYQTAKLSHMDALRLIDLVIVDAEKMNKHVAVAVCGPEGEPIAFLRMDEASPASAVIARNKAHTAARDRQETKGMGAWMRSSNTPPSFWGDDNITGFGGGVPVVRDGKVIGAIGVSGLSENEDEHLAKSAIAAAGDL
jgi:glc operon protein GlcG